jgi:hypothetical protein
MPSKIISFINVNSFNVSTIGGGGFKTMLKVEAVTKRKGDIIGLCDMRLGRSGE